MHRILLNTLVVDVPPDARDAEVEFWASALAAEAIATPMPQYHILGGAAPPNRVVVQQVDDPGPPKVHFDIHTDDLQAEVARLEGCGASVVRSFADHPGQWVVMRDPAGMEFCVVYALNERRPQADRDDFERRAREVR